MAQINDIIRDTLAAQGYTGGTSLSDLMLEYWRVKAGDPTLNTIVDAKFTFLTGAGYSGTVNGMMMQYFDDLGIPAGAYSDRWFYFWDTLGGDLQVPPYIAEGDSNSAGAGAQPGGFADSYAYYTVPNALAVTAVGGTRLVGTAVVQGSAGSEVLATTQPLIHRIKQSIANNPTCEYVVFTWGTNSLRLHLDTEVGRARGVDETTQIMWQDFLSAIALIRREGKYPIAGYIHDQGQAFDSVAWGFTAQQRSDALDVTDNINALMDLHASSDGTSFSILNTKVVNAGDPGRNMDPAVWIDNGHWGTAATDPAQDGRVTLAVKTALLSAPAFVANPAEAVAAASTATLTTPTPQDEDAQYAFVWKMEFLENWQYVYHFNVFNTQQNNALKNWKLGSGAPAASTVAGTGWTAPAAGTPAKGYVLTSASNIDTGYSLVKMNTDISPNLRAYNIGMWASGLPYNGTGIHALFGSLNTGTFTGTELRYDGSDTDDFVLALNMFVTNARTPPNYNDMTALQNKPVEMYAKASDMTSKIYMRIGTNIEHQVNHTGNGPPYDSSYGNGNLIFNGQNVFGPTNRRDMTIEMCWLYKEGVDWTEWNYGVRRIQAMIDGLV